MAPSHRQWDNIRLYYEKWGICIPLTEEGLISWQRQEWENAKTLALKLEQWTKELQEMSSFAPTDQDVTLEKDQEQPLNQWSLVMEDQHVNITFAVDVLELTVKTRKIIIRNQN